MELILGLTHGLDNDSFFRVCVLEVRRELLEFSYFTQTRRKLKTACTRVHTSPGHGAEQS